jgi:hypothetical protein
MDRNSAIEAQAAALQAVKSLFQVLETAKPGYEAQEFTVYIGRWVF